jgi:hypothetical protein
MDMGFAGGLAHLRSLRVAFSRIQAQPQPENLDYSPIAYGGPLMAVALCIAPALPFIGPLPK